ncbi:glycosyltransferase [Clostridium saccharoperbutylacetonicum]|uniref:glycosyltransferase n=1 Tax=Clostridium saccharoperbutylacetonicum TaxID=36745 RepID=UPI000983D3C4|nr:glycosyltransferase [Clostridium saccharoperbutylacetonicum]AQR96992.1 putative glycosyltransferase EpsJ [Clostridium saccharoperbutylacetonicum]NSB32871.1 glycosyltransferase involved in cell wall biosynthesis [Clostridium saccharoperbutylacetonicum]
MDNILISVIVPIYNTSKYLNSCIDSLVKQTLNEFEIILINDGSTDNSIEIAENYCRNYENIRLINQKNSGQSVARNKGIKEAKGDYIYFIDSDDIIDKNLLKTCYEKIKDKNLEMVMFGYKYLCEEGVDEHLNSKEIINSCIPSDKILNGKEIFVKDIYIRNTLASACTQLYKKDFLIQNNLYFEENIFYEDVEFIPRALIACKKIMYINKPLYIYRRRVGSTTTFLKFDGKYIYSINKVLDKTIELIIKLNKIDNELFASFRKYLNHIFKILVTYLNSIEFEKDALIKDKIKIYVGNYFDTYLKVVQEELIEEDYRFFCEQITRFGKFDREICEYIEENHCKTLKRKKIINKIKNQLEHSNSIRDLTLLKLKLDDINRTVGVYGISLHTECLINYYKKNFGEINGTIYLIDSFKGKNNEIINGIEVINIVDIKKYNLDCILISSYNSEEQLIKNAKLYADVNIPIYRFYENNNILLFG